MEIKGRQVVEFESRVSLEVPAFLDKETGKIRKYGWSESSFVNVVTEDPGNFGEIEGSYFRVDETNERFRVCPCCQAAIRKLEEPCPNEECPSKD